MRLNEYVRARGGVVQLDLCLCGYDEDDRCRWFEDGPGRLE